MEAAKRVVKNTGILYARMVITVFISLYATRLTLAALGTEDFGIFNLVGGLIAMLGFLNGSMAAATQRFMSFAQGEGKLDKVKSIFKISLVLHLLVAFVVLLVLEAMGYFFFHGILNIASARIDTAELIYQFMVISTFFTIISVPYEAVITAHENMFYFAVLGIIESIFKLAIAIYITYSPFDHLLAYGFLMATLSLLLLVIKPLYCHRKYTECRISLRNDIDKKLLSQMAEFAGWSFFGSATSMITNYGQGLVINIFFGATYNAAQGVAAQVSGQLGVFASTMLRALNPLLAKSEGAGNRFMMIKATMMGSKVGFFLLMILYVPVLLEMPYIFKLWLLEPPEYVVIFCRLLLLRDLIGQLFVTLTSSIAAAGGIRRYETMSSALATLPLATSALFFFYNFSAVALYWVYLVYAVILSIVILYFSKVNFALPIIYFIRNVVSRCILTFLLSLIVSAVPFFFFAEGFERLVLVGFLGVGSSIISFWLIGFTKEDRKEVWQLAGNFFSSGRSGLGMNILAKVNKQADEKPTVNNLKKYRRKIK